MEQTGKFRLIASHTLKWEGGYVWDRQDPGGETNMGISKRAYPDKDIKSLTYEEVLAIYYQDYYLPSGAALIESLPLASKHYDLCVNMGTRTATRLLQRAANGVGLTRLAEDGRPGPLTLQVVNACDPAQLLAGLIVVAKDRYRAIIQKRPTSQKYWRGWMNRLEDTLI